MSEEYLEVSRLTSFSDEQQKQAAIKFFNAAFVAEEAGLRQAHELAGEVRKWDDELADVLQLYGNEEGWHRELVSEYLEAIGGEVRPMGRVTRTFYSLYARARRMETITLVNLMFETIGATTYRMALRNVTEPLSAQMLKILTRDESFHVPLNVHFLRAVLAKNPQAKKRLRWVFYLLFFSLLALPLASRPRARAFDRLKVLDLVRGYARQLGGVFVNEPDLGLTPPAFVYYLLGIPLSELRSSGQTRATSVEAAEQAIDRTNQVTAL